MVLSAPFVSAQVADASFALGPELASLTPGTELSVDQLSDLGIASEKPGFVVEVNAAAQPTLGYELPPMATAKSPSTATIIGILIAGGGQIYADEINRGLTILAISTGALIGGAVIGGAAAFAGLAVYLVGWIYGLLDVEAKRYNARNGVAFAPSVIQTPNGAAPALSLAMRS